MSTQWNQQLRKCMFWKVIEWLEQNIRKQIEKNHSVQNKWTEYKIFNLKYENKNITKWG